MKKLLIALQFFEGDKKQAVELTQLISQLEKRHSDDADFLFAARFDSPHSNLAIQTAARKFDVRTFTSRRAAVGWPFGCNELWFDLMSFICEQTRAKKMPEYKAVLTFEADCVPLVPDWIPRLSEAWDRAGKYVFGSAADCGGPNGKHINGNAMFSCKPDFLEFIRRTAGCSPTKGWDYVMAPAFKRWGWCESREIVSQWRRFGMTGFDYENLLNSGAVFFHGIKDQTLDRLVRDKFLPPLRVPLVRIKNPA